MNSLSLAPLWRWICPSFCLPAELRLKISFRMSCGGCGLDSQIQSKKKRYKIHNYVLNYVHRTHNHKQLKRKRKRERKNVCAVGFFIHRIALSASFNLYDFLGWHLYHLDLFASLISRGAAGRMACRSNNFMDFLCGYSNKHIRYVF